MLFYTARPGSTEHNSIDIHAHLLFTHHMHHDFLSGRSPRWHQDSGKPIIRRVSTIITDRRFFLTQEAAAASDSLLHLLLALLLLLSGLLVLLLPFALKGSTFSLLPSSYLNLSLLLELRLLLLLLLLLLFSGLLVLLPLSLQ